MAETSLIFDRLRFEVAQRLRLAWYSGHYLAARRYAAAMRPAKADTGKRSGNPLPARAPLMAALKELQARDWRNIESGVYRLPSDLFRNPFELLDLSVRFFRDLPRTQKRRATGSINEIATTERRGRYPTYYLQNFHHQTDGYLSEDSARLYDFQVETLFTGMAEPMRRQALVPLHHLEGKDQRRVRLLDVACGTGGFLRAVKDNYPRLPVTGVDLSPDYLKEARRRLAGSTGVDLHEANAESLPFADGVFDVVTCLYLFHELPPAVRRTVAGEMARVLREGGRLILVETLQLCDRPEFDALLGAFPSGFHEPYYASYIAEDLKELFAPHGLDPVEDTLAFLSKVSVYERR